MYIIQRSFVTVHLSSLKSTGFNYTVNVRLPFCIASTSVHTQSEGKLAEACYFCLSLESLICLVLKDRI